MIKDTEAVQEERDHCGAGGGGGELRCQMCSAMADVLKWDRWGAWRCWRSEFCSIYSSREETVIGFIWNESVIVFAYCFLSNF